MYPIRGLAFFSSGGSQLSLMVINFWKEKTGGYKIFNDQNVGSHKLTIESVFILFKKTAFSTISACGVAFFFKSTFCQFETPFQRKCQSPYTFLSCMYNIMYYY